MSVSLRGNLQDFGIADVFQLIGQQRKTGVLEFSRKGERIQLLFDRGNVVSAAPVGSWPQAAFGEMLLRCGLLTRDRVEQLRAECESSAQTLAGVAISRGWLSADELRQIEDLLTRETIFAVLRWVEGSFDFSAQIVEHDRPFDSLLGAEQILMDGLRMVDEWQSFADEVPTEETVFKRVGSLAQYDERSTEEARRQRAAAERVFSLIDGRLAVRRIIDLSLVGTFDAVRALANLRRARLIEPVDPASLRALREEVRTQRPTPGRSRRFAATLLPIALLSVAAAAANVSFREHPESFTIQRPDPLVAARAGYQKRRVRRALDAYWFSTGSWPSSLEALEAHGVLPEGELASALASDMGRPYYYARRGNSIWLLAPERPDR